MIRTLFRLFAVVVGLALSYPALAADKAIIVLDASGSMWAQIDGVARIDVARQSLKAVLAGVPADLELGLMAYGHRSKGDCKDIELLVPPSAGTAAAIGTAADALSPKGRTPLSAAVKMAADALKFSENKATVILITDGIETCDADPCALASELSKQGVDFKVDVVGFGLSKTQGAQVKCLADNTGGKYLSAGDEAGLKDAIGDAVATVTQAPAPPPPASSSEEPVSTINFAPSVVLAEGADPLPDRMGNVAWEFYRVKADGTRGEWVRTEYGNAYQGTIESGTYLVNAKLDYAHAEMNVTIAAGTVARPQFDLEAGFIDIRPRPSEGAEIDGGAAVYAVFANNENATGYGEVKMFVPAGETKISVSIGSAKIDDTISVKAGENADKDIVVGAGHVTVNAFYGDGLKVTEGGLFTDIVRAKTDIQGNRAEVASGYGPDGGFDLMPGDYMAIESLDAAKMEQSFTVKAGEASAIDVMLNAGVLAISAPNATNIEVFGQKKDIQGKRAAFGNSYDLSATRTLPAGDYHIVVTLAGDAGTKEADASVKPGERTEITVQ